MLNGASVTILTILQDDDAGTSVRDQAVVLEGDIVLHNTPDLSTVLAYLFGLLYALNIDYPKQMRYTFEAIQAIFFELGGSRCSQHIRSLKTKPLLWLLMGKADMTLAFFSLFKCIVVKPLCLWYNHLPVTKSCIFSVWTVKIHYCLCCWQYMMRFCHEVF